MKKKIFITILILIISGLILMYDKAERPILSRDMNVIEYQGRRYVYQEGNYNCYSNTDIEMLGVRGGVPRLLQRYILPHGARYCENQQCMVFYLLMDNAVARTFCLEDFRYDSITIVIVEQEWASRCWNYLEERTDFCEIEPKIEKKEVIVGDVITLNDFVSYGGTITIKEITDSEVIVHFNTNGVVQLNENGTINLLSDNHYWTSAINFNEEFIIATQTMSSGKRWTITFSR